MLAVTLDIREASLDDVSSSVDSLRRCTRCVLPETMPFIEFDEDGVCNFCQNYRKMEVGGEVALEEAVCKYRGKSGEPDCIATFSGGRDSSYGLHYIKNVLKMNPIAFTYDWGMTTDLAYRNQSKMCQKLGVEQKIVLSDIKKKRENVRNNINAWLRRPDLGMVPLFMAGDKQYFYHANRLGKEMDIKLIFLFESPYEKTDFKSGFCGIRPQHGRMSVYSLPMVGKLRLAAYYAQQFLLNPAYLNTSLLNTLGGYISYYLIEHNYLSLYQYIKWDEEEIISTLRREYDWEIANDTNSTWRIGDGTASFYNFIYYIIAGFTENDTFRSNQIREGIISRVQALPLVREENKLRHDSFKWYCDTIGIDFEDTIKKITAISTLY
ncbi:hypothetical protein ACFLU2_01015 [Chloroflexota bacterium]